MEFAEQTGKPAPRFLRDFAIRDGDPLVGSLLVCLSFFLIGLVRLGSPELLYFDEQWYVRAAARMLNLDIMNREHPMLAKEIIAAFYWVFDGKWVGIRLSSLVFGTIGLFGFQRAHFYLTRSAVSTIIFGILVSANCLYLATSRIAMLDAFMLGFAGVGLAFFARSILGKVCSHIDFALAGLCMGAAMASKWSVAPLCVFMALVTIVRYRSRPGLVITLGIVASIPAALVYVASFAPLLFANPFPLSVSDLVPLHRVMVFHLGSLIVQHPYQSFWWEWLFGAGQIYLLDPIWYDTDRTIVLSQNPVATLMVIPSLVIGTAWGLRRKNMAIGTAIAAFLFTLLFWAVGQKPNLFVYHYNLPLIFALSVASQVGVTLAATRLRTIMFAILATYLAAFALFYPLATGGKQSPVTEWTRTFHGWSDTPNAREVWRPLGNGIELRAWGNRCLNEPRKLECVELRRNTAEHANAWGR